jgi:hypothetical protein
MRFRDLTVALVVPIVILAALLWAGLLQSSVPLKELWLPLGAGLFTFTVLSALAGVDRRTGGRR